MRALPSVVWDDKQQGCATDQNLIEMVISVLVLIIVIKLFSHLVYSLFWQWQQFVEICRVKCFCVKWPGVESIFKLQAFSHLEVYLKGVLCLCLWIILVVQLCLGLFVFIVKKYRSQIGQCEGKHIFSLLLFWVVFYFIFFPHRPVQINKSLNCVRLWYLNCSKRFVSSCSHISSVCVLCQCLWCLNALDFLCGVKLAVVPHHGRASTQQKKTCLCHDINLTFSDSLFSNTIFVSLLFFFY